MEMISELAVVETGEIGPGTAIHPFAVVRSGARLGRNVIIHPHAVIETGVEIGDGVEVLPGAYLGKVPKGAGATARVPDFERRVIIGPECAIGPHAVIYYDVQIGRNTLIGDGASIREKVRIGDHCIISRGVTINYNTTIGNRTKIMDLTHITGNCEIGDDVFIAVLVATTNDSAIGKQGYDEARMRGPRIANGAAIGAMANLLPGVSIGAGAVIAAGSLVSRDIPAGKFALGSPARVLKDAGAE
jgi:acetyltransferase-like isoleucine patch superfamily enzyme